MRRLVLDHHLVDTRFSSRLSPKPHVRHGPAKTYRVELGARLGLPSTALDLDRRPARLRTHRVDLCRDGGPLR